MPKFYGQNKKRVDPRYFLHENEEDAASLRDKLAKSRRSSEAPKRIRQNETPPWQDPSDPVKSPHERATALAQQGMEAASAPAFDATASLSDGTSVLDVLTNVRKQLNIPGARAVLQQFDMMLRELGVEVGDAPVPGSDIDVPESDAEISASGPSDEEINRSYYGTDHHPNDDDRW